MNLIDDPYELHYPDSDTIIAASIGYTMSQMGITMQEFARIFGELANTSGEVDRLARAAMTGGYDYENRDNNG